MRVTNLTKMRQNERTGRLPRVTRRSLPSRPDERGPGSWEARLVPGAAAWAQVPQCNLALPPAVLASRGQDLAPRAERQGGAAVADGQGRSELPARGGVPQTDLSGGGPPLPG